jgi:hypothetical protein
MTFAYVKADSHSEGRLYKATDAGVAQPVEQRIRNAQVKCSNHSTSSKKTSVIVVITEVFCFLQYVRGKGNPP